jgi:pimeloyl-ACP methyl ester carboxylesterase
MLLTAVELYFFLPLLFLIAIEAVNRVLGGCGSRKTPPSVLCLLHARAYLYLLLYVAIYLFVALPLWILSALGVRSERLPEQEGDAPVIILVHGYLATVHHWIIFRRFLKKRGFRYIVSFGYRSYSTDIETAAEELTALAERYAGRGVIFIGHSLGGLLAVRSAAKLPAGSAKVITLGSPLAGTEMARIAITPNARKLLPGSGAIRKTEEILRTKNFPMKCYWSEFDRIILPAQSAAPQNGDCIELPGASHAGYLFNEIEI